MTGSKATNATSGGTTNAILSDYERIGQFTSDLARYCTYYIAHQITQDAEREMWSNNDNVCPPKKNIILYLSRYLFKPTRT